MDDLARRIRGVTGVALGWGAAWAVIGAGVGAVLGVLTPDPWQGWNPVLEWALGMGLYGVVSGAGFGKLIALLERRRTLDDLTLPRVAVWGVLGSAAVPLAFGALGMFEPGTTTLDVVEAIALCGTLGGSFAAGSLALARRAGPEEASALASAAPRGLLGDAAIPDPLRAAERERHEAG